MSKKYALILGGSSGLGLSTAHKLASIGYNLIIVHRDRRATDQTFQKEVHCLKSLDIKVKSYNLDALKKESIKKVTSEIETASISILIHSIAKGSLKPLYAQDAKQLTKEDFDLTIHAMATSWLEWTQALISNKLITNAFKNIAFTSEGNSKVWSGYGAVSAAKVTLESLMRYMAVEYAPLGITTNCIQAGVTETESFKMIPNSESLANFARKRNPFQRLTLPEDVANAVFLLVQEEAKWINGTVLKVDGGESLR